MRKIILLVGVLTLVATTVWALETFESPVVKKEEQQVYGSGTLSVATTVYSIWVMNRETTMKIEVPKKAFDLLVIGDIIRVSYEKGLFMNEIKKIALVRPASQRAPEPPNGEQR